LMWRIVPYHDAWVRIDDTNAEVPRFDHISGRTRLRAVSPGTAKRALRDAATLVARSDADDPEMRERLDAFVENFDDWQRIAAQRADPLLAGFGMEVGAPLAASVPAEPFNPALAQLRGVTPAAE